jgi:hypothetical protein
MEAAVEKKCISPLFCFAYRNYDMDKKPLLLNMGKIFTKTEHMYLNS